MQAGSIGLRSVHNNSIPPIFIIGALYFNVESVLVDIPEEPENLNQMTQGIGVAVKGYLKPE